MLKHWIEEHKKHISDSRERSLVYDYTNSSAMIRNDYEKMNRLQTLILKAPILPVITLYAHIHGYYRVCIVGKSQNKLYSYDNLKEGDIFYPFDSEKVVGKRCIISTTYNSKVDLSLHGARDSETPPKKEDWTYIQIQEWSRRSSSFQQKVFSLRGLLERYHTPEELSNNPINMLNSKHTENQLNEIFDDFTTEYTTNSCCGYRLSILNTSGKGLIVEGYSKHSHEREVILPCGIKFKVLHIHRPPKSLWIMNLITI